MAKTETPQRDADPQPFDKALADKEAAEGKPAQLTYTLGGIDWNITTPLPGFLIMKLVGNGGNVSVSFEASYQLIYAALGDQREAFDKRMMETPTVELEEVDDFVVWLIQNGTSRPTEPR